jgi:hypothetical protein
MEAWKKGAVVGFVFPPIGYLVGVYLSETLPENLEILVLVLVYPIIIVSRLFHQLTGPCVGSGCDVPISFFIAPFFWLIIGSIIGFAVDKYKQRRSGK